MRPSAKLAAGFLLTCLMLAWSAAWPAVASAHTRGGEALGLTSGLLHPISGLDHVLAMIAVGLWGAQLGLIFGWSVRGA